MQQRRTPIGGTHARDFDSVPMQVPLTNLSADERGYVRFRCMVCPRTGKIRLSDLHARFKPTDGLVNILNAVRPKDCTKSPPDPWGIVRCGFCYRDLP